MKQIKVLSIAPYEGLCDLMTAVAAEFPEISLTSRVGDLQEGVNTVLALSEREHFDVIISRGGTAELIRASSSVPTLELPITVSDVLQAIKLAEHYRERYAIIGFQSITRSAETVCKLLQYDIPIFTIHADNTARETAEYLQEIKQQGYSMILCDVITMKLAHQCGLNGVLITSSEEGVRQSLTLATDLFSISSKLREENCLLRKALKKQDESCMILSRSQGVTFRSDAHPREEYEAFLQNFVTDFLGEYPVSMVRIINGTQYHIVVRQTDDDDVFIADTRFTDVPVFYEKSGVLIYNYNENLQNSLQTDFHHYFGSATKMTQLRVVLEGAATKNMPILLQGEPGTGKDSAAYFLYESGPRRNSPLYHINCEIITEKHWQLLMESAESPLQGEGATVFFSAAHLIPPRWMARLRDDLRFSSLHVRNRLIFSVTEESGVVTPHAICEKLQDVIPCKWIRLPPLRERRRDISGLTTLYINHLNSHLAKQIIGFDKGALERLEEYRWPKNLAQFKRVLRELVDEATSFYISEEATARALRREEGTVDVILNTEQGYTLDLSKTMEEINLDILKLVLEEEHGRRKNAAERLGISRSTVWRLLQSEGADGNRKNMT